MADKAKTAVIRFGDGIPPPHLGFDDRDAREIYGYKVILSREVLGLSERHALFGVASRFPLAVPLTLWDCLPPPIQP